MRAALSLAAAVAVSPLVLVEATITREVGVQGQFVRSRNNVHQQLNFSEEILKLHRGGRIRGRQKGA